MRDMMGMKNLLRKCFENIKILTGTSGISPGTFFQCVICLTNIVLADVLVAAILGEVYDARGTLAAEGASHAFLDHATLRIALLLDRVPGGNFAPPAPPVLLVGPRRDEIVRMMQLRKDALEALKDEVESFWRTARGIQQRADKQYSVKVKTLEARLTCVEAENAVLRTPQQFPPRRGRGAGAAHADDGGEPELVAPRIEAPPALNVAADVEALGPRGRGRRGRGGGARGGQ